MHSVQKWNVNIASYLTCIIFKYEQQYHCWYKAAVPKLRIMSLKRKEIFYKQFFLYCEKLHEHFLWHKAVATAFLLVLFHHHLCFVKKQKQKIVQTQNGPYLQSFIPVPLIQRFKWHKVKIIHEQFISAWFKMWLLFDVLIRPYQLLRWHLFCIWCLNTVTR